MKKLRNKVAVIGAGASGLMAAVTAADCGAEVVIYESNDRPGRKLLLTGNGKCNLTHENAADAKYHGSVGENADIFFRRFGSEDTMDFFTDNGLIMYNRNGYIYPYSFQSSSVLEILTLKAGQLNVCIESDSEVTGISQNTDGGFILEINCNGKQHSVKADRVIIACGGRAVPRSGSDGQGYRLAEMLGHKIKPVFPALCGIKCSDKDCRDAEKARQRGKIILLTGNRIAAEDTGEIQFTDYGLSGIPVFNISRYISESAMCGEKNTICRIDTVPFLSLEILTDFLENKIRNINDINISGLTAGTINKKIADIVIKRINLNPSLKAETLTHDMIKKIAEGMKQLDYHVTSVNPFSEAQTSAGGIPFEEITDDLESAICPDLYFAGEMLDIDGQCGGYNLQWAWTSGYISGMCAAEQ